MDSEYKIMHLLKSNVFSGAENVVCQIIEMFKNTKFKMFYASPNGKIEKSLRNKNIEYIPLKKLSVFNIRKVIKKYKINILHAHDPASCVLATLSSRKVKIVAHVHGNHYNMRIISIKSILFLIASIRFSKIIWVSDTALNDYYFSKMLKKKSCILINVINDNEIHKKLTDRFIEHYNCIYLGRLSEEKDPIRAINIISEVIKNNPNYKCVFVGDGILKEDCLELVASLGIENNVVFKGYLDNPYPILKNSKVLLMSSKYEGTPMSALEAMSLGKPIISTPTDGLLSLIENNVSGVYSDSNNVIVNALLELEKDENMYASFSNKTLQIFDRINNIDRYKKILLEIYIK